MTTYLVDSCVPLLISVTHKDINDWSSVDSDLVLDNLPVA